jgi:hypothetical protein
VQRQYHQRLGAVAFDDEEVGAVEPFIELGKSGPAAFHLDAAISA